MSFLSPGMPITNTIKKSIQDVLTNRQNRQKSMTDGEMRSQYHIGEHCSMRAAAASIAEDTVTQLTSKVTIRHLLR